MNEIIMLTDYRNGFGSSYYSLPYRSGFIKKYLEAAFAEYNLKLIWMTLAEVDFTEDWDGKLVLYTSSEDDKVLYKSYIEDVIHGLELKGAIVIPKYKYLRAHHNKVFMEILRSQLSSDTGLKSLCFGTLEESIEALKKGKIQFPCVIKSAAGAMSRGVVKAANEKEFLSRVSRLTKTTNLKLDIKDKLRPYKHKNYIPESTHRMKFIVQPMVQGLENDWKVLIYGDKIYNLKRHVRKNDFRASGSHNNYKIGSESGLTSEMMDFVYDIYKKLDVPMLSFDLAYDGKKYYMIEYQVIYFGPSTFRMSKDYYVREDNHWILKSKGDENLESVFAYAIHKYLQDKNLIQ